jgi:hypothetical protein
MLTNNERASMWNFLKNYSALRIFRSLGKFLGMKTLYYGTYAQIQ